MKKLLILVLLSITAFLGVNQTKVSTYAATTPGVTYVTEGNRVYVHFGNDVMVDEVTHAIDLNITTFLSTEEYEQYYLLNQEQLRVYFEKPENAVGLFIEISHSGFTDNENFIIFYPDVDNFSNSGNQFLLYYNGPTQWAVLENDYQYEAYFSNGDVIRIYFEIEQPPIKASDAEFVTVGNRAYLAFNGLTLIDTANIDPTSSIFEIDIPENVTNLIIADETNSIRYNWANTGTDTENEVISGYDNLYISTNSYEFYLEVEGVDPYLTQILTAYEDGHYPYGLNSMSKFYIYFELVPFEDAEPLITGSLLPVNIDNPLPEATLRNEISAWDDLDGDISDQLVYEGGTYETARIAGTLVVGTQYTILYSVEDSSGNVTLATIYVQAVDIAKPTFGIVNTTIEIAYTDTLDVTAFRSNLLVTDNYDDAEDIIVNILSNTYTANKTVPGTYTIVYRAIDTSSNYRDITITVNVIDDVGPVITGDSNFNVPLSPKPALSTILAQFSATDAIDGNVTDSLEVITDNYSAATAPGIYSVTIRFTDESGNATNKTFTISVVDGLPPVLFISSGLLIGVNQFETLTLAQIVQLLETQGTITGFVVLSNNYAGNENVPGTYQMAVNYSLNGVPRTQVLSIMVTGSNILKWTVSFVTNGGSTIASILVDNLEQLLVQAPTRTGYRFVGWYKDAELTQPFSIVTGRISSDTTLFAKWVPINSGAPSVIIDNLSNLKAADIALIVAAIAVSIGIGFGFASKKKPTKRKRG